MCPVFLLPLEYPLVWPLWRLEGKMLIFTARRWDTSLPIGRLRTSIMRIQINRAVHGSRLD